MEAGKLTKWITLQGQATTQDAELNPVTTWTDWRTVKAEPLTKTSREFFRLATNNAEITHVFRIRYIGGVTAYKRVKFGRKLLEIIGEPDNEGERNVSLLITCKGAS